MINPLIISRLIEAGYTVYLPIDGAAAVVVREPRGDALCECYCVNVSQDQDHSPILKCPADPMIVAAADVTTGTVWIVPVDYVAERKTLRMGRDMEEFIVPQPKSPSFKEAQEMRKRRLKALEEDVRKSIERIKGAE